MDFVLKLVGLQAEIVVTNTHREARSQVSPKQVDHFLVQYYMCKDGSPSDGPFSLHQMVEMESRCHTSNLNGRFINAEFIILNTNQL